MRWISVVHFLVSFMSLFSVHPTVFVCMGARRTVKTAEQLCCAIVLVHRCVNVYFCFLTKDNSPFQTRTSQTYCDSITFSRSFDSCVFLHYTHLFIHFIHSFRVHFIAFCENCFCSHTKCQYSIRVPTFYFLLLR